jgi:hypothetical protein
MAVTAPVVTAQAAASIDYQSETLNGTLTDDGTEAPSVWGFNVGLTTAYGTNVTAADVLDSGDTFTLPVAGLTENTTYHFRAFATNSAGTGVSTDGTFTTVRNPKTNYLGTLAPSMLT